MRDRRLRGRGERGAVLIIFAVFALVAVMLLAAVVDLGNQRQELKQVTLSTDAAALAAASTIRFGTPASTGTNVDCSSVPSTEAGRTVGDIAQTYWTGNGGRGPLDCRVFFDAQPNSAYVTVTATNEVDYAFSGATGQRTGSATGSSSARIASARGGLLYPVGLCTEGALQALATAPTGEFKPPQPTTVVFDAACGGSGNKRQIQFNVGLRGNSCGAEGMWCWDFNNGGFDAGPNMSPIVESDTGKDWQKAEGTINTLATNKTHIWIPVVQSRPDLGTNGTFAKYEITHFAEVQITSYSKRRGLGFLVHRIVRFEESGPPASSQVHTARVHLCGTGQGVGGCDAKAAPAPSYVVPDPVLDFRDLCKVTGIAYAPGQTVRVGADGRLTEPVTVSYTVENPVNCDPPVTLHAASTSGTVAATPGARSGNIHPFTFPIGTLLGPDNTPVVLRFAEDGLLADDTGRLSTLGPCRVLGVTVLNPKATYSLSGNALAEPVDLRITVSRPETCANLAIQAVEQKNGSNPVRNAVWDGSPSQSTFEVRIASGSRTYQNNTTWDVLVFQGATQAQLPYTPGTTFRT